MKLNDIVRYKYCTKTYRIVRIYLDRCVDIQSIDDAVIYTKVAIDRLILATIDDASASQRHIDSLKLNVEYFRNLANTHYRELIAVNKTAQLYHDNIHKLHTDLSYSDHMFEDLLEVYDVLNDDRDDLRSDVEHLLDDKDQLIREIDDIIKERDNALSHISDTIKNNELPALKSKVRSIRDQGKYITDHVDAINRIANS